MTTCKSCICGQDRDPTKTCIRFPKGAPKAAPEATPKVSAKKAKVSVPEAPKPRKRSRRKVSEEAVTVPTVTITGAGE